MLSRGSMAIDAQTDRKRYGGIKGIGWAKGDDEDTLAVTVADRPATLLLPR